MKKRKGSKEVKGTRGRSDCKVVWDLIVCETTGPKLYDRKEVLEGKFKRLVRKDRNG